MKVEHVTCPDATALQPRSSLDLETRQIVQGVCGAPCDFPFPLSLQ